MKQRDMAQLSGEVHIYGAYVNGHIRPKNKKVDRIDRRLAIHQNPTKRCVLVFSIVLYIVLVSAAPKNTTTSNFLAMHFKLAAVAAYLFFHFAIK